MNKEEFKKVFMEYVKKIDIDINEEQINKFYDYMNLLIEWNKKINLTAITDYNEIILKHFVDSLTINKCIKENNYVVDVGTGAGFPGIPLKIIRDDIKIVLVDSLNKRINFLNEVIKELNLKKEQTFHQETPLDFDFVFKIQDMLRNRKELFFKRRIPQVSTAIDTTYD